MYRVGSCVARRDIKIKYLSASRGHVGLGLALVDVALTRAQNV